MLATRDHDLVAGDLPTALAFASFASGSVTLAELEAVLTARVATFLDRPPRPDGEGADLDAFEATP